MLALGNQFSLSGFTLNLIKEATFICGWQSLNVTHPGVLLARAQVNLDNVDHDCRITIAFSKAQSSGNAMGTDSALNLKSEATSVCRGQSLSGSHPGGLSAGAQVNVVDHECGMTIAFLVGQKAQGMLLGSGWFSPYHRDLVSCL